MVSHRGGEAQVVGEENAPATNLKQPYTTNTPLAGAHLEARPLRGSAARAGWVFVTVEPLAFKPFAFKATLKSGPPPLHRKPRTNKKDERHSSR